MGRCQAGVWHGCVCSLGRLQPCLACPSWGCVPTQAAPLSPFRAEEPEGPSVLISLQAFLESHPYKVFFFPSVTGGVGVSCPSLLESEPAGPYRSLLGAAVWQTTQTRNFWAFLPQEMSPVPPSRVCGLLCSGAGSSQGRESPWMGSVLL